MWQWAADLAGRVEWSAVEVQVMVGIEKSVASGPSAVEAARVCASWPRSCLYFMIQGMLAFRSQVLGPSQVSDEEYLLPHHRCSMCCAGGAWRTMSRSALERREQIAFRKGQLDQPRPNLEEEREVKSNELKM